MPNRSYSVKNQRRAVHLGVDAPLLLIMITLTIFGLLIVYSASWDNSLTFYGNPTEIFSRQFAWAVLGLLGATFLTFMDYHYWRKLAVPVMGLIVAALFAVLFVNEVRNGAVRTLWSGSIQPSEAAKLITVIYLSVWLFSKRDRLSDVSFGLIPLAVILGLLGGLIFLQPDISAVATIFFLGGMMFFLAGGDLRQIGLLVMVAVLVGWLIVRFNPTGNERVALYLDGLHNPLNASYHVRRSLEAFVKGGWFGVGIGKSQTKLTGLPFPFTDSIFAVVGEETGLFGAASLVGLYALLVWRGLVIARRAPDEMGALLSAGLCLWIGMEAFVNMAVMVNLLPFAGNALPFMSAGGSNLVVSMAAMGIVLNISRQAVKKEEMDRSWFGAVIDLRRRDGRWGLPRAQRTPGVDRRR